jgi:hypothetical protein
MAISWDVKREIVNAATELSKVIATRTDSTAGTANSFCFKGCMKTTEEKNACWDDIWAQYQAVKTKEAAVDSVADEGVTDLEAREV